MSAASKKIIHKKAAARKISRHLIKLNQLNYSFNYFHKLRVIVEVI